MQCICATVSSVACLVLQYISTLSHKWHNSGGGGVTAYKMRVLIFSTTSVRNISDSKKK